jgi:hypothetical protein
MDSLRGLLFSILIWLGVMPKPDLVVRTVSDHPERQKMKPGILYVVGGNGFTKWAYFLCPAKLDEVIQLSLQPNRRPRWQVATDFWGRPTITPSVRQLAGSYAHFWVRTGKIDWCIDTGKPPVSKNDAYEEGL